MDNGWQNSASAWVADMGEEGDFSRAHVLDGPMRARVRASGARTALDVGCGEGRFCRMMAADGVEATGLDPTTGLIEVARARGPQRYVEARAEAMPLSDAAFDLVVAYLTLIDIDDLAAAYSEMIRVLRPGGRLLVANLSSFATALPDGELNSGWMRDEAGGCIFACDNYHDERSFRVGWRGIRVLNHHRTMQSYMAPLLASGLQLAHFAEPEPSGGPPEKVARYRRAPLFFIMEWLKPGA